MYNFNNSKKSILSKKDKSNKGELDSKIVRLCQIINKNKDYFTTSSCSGRIKLIIDINKKKPDLIIFRTHDKISLKELKKQLLIKNKDTIYFKQEPCFVVVSSRNSKKQWELFNLARNNGWKKSGILSLDKKLLIELMGTENISFPIMKKGKLLVDDEFLKIVIKKANSNLKRGWEKIKYLEKSIK